MDKNNVDFTEKELKIVYFFVTKKKFLKKILIGFLILINIFIYTYLIYHSIQYLTQSKEYQMMEKELTSQNVNFSIIRQAISPIPVSVVFSKAIPLSGFKYHLVCLVENLNKDWFIKSLDYKFILSGFETKSFKSFLLPEEKKILTDFNETITQRPDSIFCQISNIKWQRVKPDKRHLLEIPKNFIIKDLKYQQATKIDESNILTFKFINSTIYNFWEIDLLINFYSKKEIVWVEKIKIKEIMSKEERGVKIILPNFLPFISEIEVQPEINVFDQSSFIPLRIKPKER